MARLKEAVRSPLFFLKSSNMKIMKEKRVLLIRVGKLGDTIWGTSPIDSLVKYYGPNVKIDLLVKNGMGGLFTHDPRVDRVFEIVKRRLPLLLSPTKLRVLWHSIKMPYDLALDMETQPFFRFLFLFLCAKKKVSAYTIRHDVGIPTEHAVMSVRKIVKLAISRELAEAVTPRLVIPRGGGGIVAPLSRSKPTISACTSAIAGSHPVERICALGLRNTGVSC